MTSRKRFRLISLGALLVASVALAGPHPSVGLYWYENVDPTAGAGVCAPLYQLLIRTDSPSTYAKTSSACTGWTRIGQLGVGTGSVTQVACGTGLSCAPSPIVAAGTATLSIAGDACAAGNFTSAISSAGVGTCSAATGTISGLTAPDLPKAASATSLGNSSVADSGAIFSIATTKLTVDETTGDTAIAGTLTADSGNRAIDAAGTGLAITGNQLRVSIAGDSCAANQFTTAISSAGVGTCGAVSGTISGLTSGTAPKASSASALANSTSLDDGATYTLGGKLAINESNGTSTLTGTANASPALLVTHTLAASTSGSIRSIRALQAGTVDTTAGALNSIGIKGEVTTTRSAGANPLVNYGVEGLASGSQVENIGVHAVVSGTTGSTSNIGLFVENTTTGGALAYGFHSLVTATATTNKVLLLSAAGGGTNECLETTDGNVLFNSQSGATTIIGAAAFWGALTGNTGNVTFGLGGTRNAHPTEKHDGSRNVSLTGCGAGALVTGSDLAMTVTLGTGTVNGCVIGFITAYATNPPTCRITARTGSNQAGLLYTINTTDVTLTTATASAIYDILCEGHL